MNNSENNILNFAIGVCALSIAKCSKKDGILKLDVNMISSSGKKKRRSYNLGDLMIMINPFRQNDISWCILSFLYEYWTDPFSEHRVLLEY
jgi:hypothetical protein